MWSKVIAGISVGILVAACGTTQRSDERATVVVTAWPIEELVNTIAGDRVRVVSLAAPGVEPHDLELDSADLEELTRASLVVTVAEGFQPAVDRAVVSNDLPLLVAADHVEPADEDPHLWLDPKAWADVARGLGEALAPLVADPTEVRTRARNLEVTLDDHSDRWESILAGCERKTVIVMHDAFVRWERFGLRIESLLGRVPGAEPTASRIAELARVVRQTRSEVIFTELGSPERIARALADEAEVDVATLDPLENAVHGPYLERMTANLESLAEGLGCPLP
ncbi:MAG: metal ABC transporter substrate-binding protein [Actinomycetota bacterium]